MNGTIRTLNSEVGHDSQRVKEVVTATKVLEQS
jgi:hypothetical protein